MKARPAGCTLGKGDKVKGELSQMAAELDSFRLCRALIWEAARRCWHARASIHTPPPTSGTVVASGA